MEEKIKNLKYVFEPKSVAIIGASRHPYKIGNVVLRNFIEGGFEGKIYPVNPKAETILGMKCYPSVMDIPDEVDSAVIAVPAKFVPSVLEECGKKGVKGVVIISGGFGEVGNVEGERKIKEIAEKYGMAVIGPNCMGVISPSKRVDSVFLPIYKMGRPRKGEISFISQSGAVGGCIVDLAAHYGVGMEKFVSYGNATVVDESDLLCYLANDRKTKQIVIYLEGVKDGKKFFKILKKAAAKKPVIILKAGKSEIGKKAAKSHTGAMAGSYLAYKAVIRQSKAIEVDSLEELFDVAKVFSQPLPKGKRIGVITNGGGLGVLTTDAIEEFGLKLAEFSEETKEKLKKFMPSYANITNPLDLIGDADALRYEQALATLMEDKNVDALVVVVLFQTVSLDSRIINVLVNASQDRRKPIVVIATGGEYTEMHRRILESYDVPTYTSPKQGVKALAKYIKYGEERKNL